MTPRVIPRNTRRRRNPGNRRSALLDLDDVDQRAGAGGAAVQLAADGAAQALPGGEHEALLAEYQLGLADQAEDHAGLAFEIAHPLVHAERHDGDVVRRPPPVGNDVDDLDG